MCELADLRPHGAPLATIVGLGVVSSLGIGVSPFWHALFDTPSHPDRTAIRGFAEHDDALRHAYVVRDLPAFESSISGSNRFEQMAFAALREALSDARWADAASKNLTLGVFLGTAAGDTESTEAASSASDAPNTTRFVDNHGYRLIDQFDAAGLPEICGPVMSVSAACAAGLYALTLAAEFLANGMADAICVVGVDILSRVTQAAFQRMTALDPERCRPFDANRSGTVFGEGAVAMLLVPPEIGAQFPRRYCDLFAYGLSCDAHHPTAPRPDGHGMQMAMQRALAAAGLDAHEIGFVFPHGTGTPLNDRIEGQLLGTLFAEPRLGSHNGPAVLPVKAHIGHCAGASGSFSALAAVMALAEREIPAADHTGTTDPSIPIHLSSRPVRLEETGGSYALVNAYGFGGANTSVIFGAAR